MKVLIRLGAAALIAGVSAGSALASPLLDQSHTASTVLAQITDNWLPGFQRAMTFTVGISGDLTSVDVAVTGGTLGLDVLLTSGGVPTETALTTGTLSSVSGDYSIFSTSLAVRAGEVLALEPICLSGIGTCGEWLARVPNTYVGGENFIVDPYYNNITTFTADQNYGPFTQGDDFRTFVDPAIRSVPEPLTLSLFGASLASAAAFRRRRKMAA